MKKTIALMTLALLSVTAHAADSKIGRKTASQGPVEVDALVKCEDGSDFSAAIRHLNGAISSREVHANMYESGENGTVSGDQAIVIKKPFKVSAPDVSMKDGSFHRVCVTITK